MTYCSEGDSRASGRFVTLLSPSLGFIITVLSSGEPAVSASLALDGLRKAIPSRRAEVSLLRVLIAAKGKDLQRVELLIR